MSSLTIFVNELISDYYELEKRKNKILIILLKIEEDN